MGLGGAERMKLRKKSLR